jgi:hypothetical protein
LQGIKYMKYYNIKKKQKLPNKTIDEFLTSLHFLCKKYKLTFLNPKGNMVVRSYNKNNAKTMLRDVWDDIAITEKNEDENELSN